MFVYLDESGDTGFKFSRGSSRHFVVALILVDDPEPLEDAVHSYRDSLRWASHREFHFAKTDDKTRQGFFRAIRGSEFAVRALVIDKALIRVPELRKEETFHSHVVSLILDHARDDLIDAQIIVDEPVQNKRKQAELRTRLRRTLNADPHAPRIRDIHWRPSHTDSLLQVADMVCGAINATYERGEGKYRQMIVLGLRQLVRVPLVGQVFNRSSFAG